MAAHASLDRALAGSPAISTSSTAGGGVCTPTSDAEEEERTRRRERKLAADAERPLESWERYRALVDMLEEANKLADLGDHKARFALVITGALNLALFFMGTRSELAGGIPAAWRPALAAYLAAYALVALYFFFHAIEALRPRTLRLGLRAGRLEDDGAPHRPLGLRFHEDALTRDVAAYAEAWRRVRIDQLNAELAAQAHAVSSANSAQYQALRRLYLGLHVMTFMLAGLLALGSWVLLAAATDGARVKVRAGRPARGGLNVLGAPERLASAGVREPSGLAWDARRGWLWVVGDEGRLAWVDGAGVALGSTRVAGDLEDVAPHTPSGRLLLLAERKAELIWYDPDRRAELRRWRLDTAAVLGLGPTERGLARNRGFEGLAFREQAGRPGGGLFYLVHQAAPASLLTLAFDPETHPAGTLGAEVVVGRFALEPHADLKAAAWVAEIGRLLVLAESEDRLLVLDDDGRVQAEVVLPGAQQEGLGFDGSGALWVADERAGLLRFAGARDALARGLGSMTPSAPPEGGAR